FDVHLAGNGHAHDAGLEIESIAGPVVVKVVQMAAVLAQELRDMAINPPTSLGFGKLMGNSNRQRGHNQTSCKNQIPSSFVAILVLGLFIAIWFLVFGSF